MNKKYTIPIFLVLIVAILILYQVLANKGTDIKTGTNIGDTAPDFTLKKVNGEELTLRDFRGKKILINFWTTWCEPCKIEMPDIQKLHEEQKNVQVLTINMQEERGKVINFLFTKGYTFPALLDPKREVSSSYLVRSIPTTYFIDENGVIINKITRILTYQQMLDMLKI